ncbi:MAG: hypothetical protein VYE22_31990 [Myxococcota bacterium]|nr:hypothetical protein [Myxococcota bacterium]
MRRLLALALLLLPGCLAPGCPCGSSTSDPLSEHDVSFPGLHALDDACACRCGDDPPTSAPRDRDCAEYEGRCEDEAGVRRDRYCQ